MLFGLYKLGIDRFIGPGIVFSLLIGSLIKYPIKAG
jgi:hypothetical protein